MLKELVVIALPIGNAQDLTLRALAALKSVDGILAEDTRKFKEFCRWAGIELNCPVQSYDAHSEREINTKKLFEKLSGKWALVSDAGTPAVNDPGSQIVKDARALGVVLSALPGASALTLALQISGGFGNPVTFLGFTPKKVKKDFFEKFLGSKTIVFFESKHNVMATLETLKESQYKNSKLVCLREMTKEHEEYFEGSLEEHIQYFEKKLKKDQVGELTFVLEGSESESLPSQIALNMLVEFRAAGPSQAAKILSKLCSVSREEAYELLKGCSDK